MQQRNAEADIITKGDKAMARVRGLTKAGYEEKGQRTARSTDVYMPKAGMKEVAVCTGCQALYWNKRWYASEDESTKLSNDMIRNEVLCPACQRVQDNNPAGIVTLAGDYLVSHENDILNTIRNVEEKSRSKNPLARIMTIVHEGAELKVLTTNDKLAQRVGRDVFKAHSGNLEYKWNREDSFVRVNWSR